MQLLRKPHWQLPWKQRRQSNSIFVQNFLGDAPAWYKLVILLFMFSNSLIFWLTGDAAAELVSWLILAQFIFTLAMALQCYPLQPGGLLALQALLLGLTDFAHIQHEINANWPVIMLLIFMVAAIFFLKELLMVLFTRMLLVLKNKVILAIAFTASSAVLSAFLDALTVTAVLISVAVGFFSIYQNAVSQLVKQHGSVDEAQLQAELTEFRHCLRSLIMHGLVGTALGGVMTLVGEPQNLLIAHQAGWQFAEFFWQMAPVTIPVFIAGLFTTFFLEKTGLFGYGSQMPEHVLHTLQQQVLSQSGDKEKQARLIVQSLTTLFLLLALLFHWAEVGLIGLAVIILLTSFNGITRIHQLQPAFVTALPFVALLAVFFTIVSMIQQQALFEPFIAWLLLQPESDLPALFYLANGLLSAISDNVFVASIYINESKMALQSGLINQSQFEDLAVAINTGTNLPSIATPNGQAAFLFLLTSALAPLLRLSYQRMVWMALPYTLVLSSVGYLAVSHWL